MNSIISVDMEQKVISASSDSHDSVGQSVIEHQDLIPPCDSNGSSGGDPDSPVQVALHDKEGSDSTEIPVMDPKTDKSPKKGGRISKKQEEVEKYLVKNLFEKMTFLEILVTTGLNEKRVDNYYSELVKNLKRIPDLGYETSYCEDLPIMLETMSKGKFTLTNVIKIEYKDEVFTLSLIKPEE
jgi:hypothetical protein